MGSGELVGIPENDETHYCGDFFRVPEDMNVHEYLEWCATPITKGLVRMRRDEYNFLPSPNKSDFQIALIVDITDPRLKELLALDAYDPAVNEKMKNIVTNLRREVVDGPQRTISAVLVGAPANFIPGLIVSDDIPDSDIADIREAVGSNRLILRTSGQTV